MSISFVSHLLQMRGLKPVYEDILVVDIIVASFTDAWIETILPLNLSVGNLSRIFYRCVD